MRRRRQRGIPEMGLPVIGIVNAVLLLVAVWHLINLDIRGFFAYVLLALFIYWRFPVCRTRGNASGSSSAQAKTERTREHSLALAGLRKLGFSLGEITESVDAMYRTNPNMEAGEAIQRYLKSRHTRR